MAEKTLQQSIELLLSLFAVEIGYSIPNVSQVLEKYLDKILEAIKEKLWTSTMMS